MVLFEIVAESVAVDMLGFEAGARGDNRLGQTGGGAGHQLGADLFHQGLAKGRRLAVAVGGNGLTKTQLNRHLVKLAILTVQMHELGDQILLGDVLPLARRLDFAILRYQGIGQ